MANERKTVGVIGGLGPEATLDFFAKVLAKTRAATDQEHLHLIINNRPDVPNRNEAVAGTGPSPGPALAENARSLAAAGADFLVMVCNAAHAFQQDITETVDLPFVSIVDETVQATLSQLPEVKKVGVLGSSGCLDARLYQDAFAKQDVTTLVPEGEQRDTFMRLLYQVKGGNKGAEVKTEMRRLAQNLIIDGAEAIVAGCTEVPLVLFENDLRVPLVNSTDVLVDSTIAYATGERQLNEVRNN